MAERYCMHMVKLVIKDNKFPRPMCNSRIKCPDMSVCCFCCRKCKHFPACLQYHKYQNCIDRGIAITEEQLIVNIL